MTIEQGIDAWLDEHRPDAVAVERVFARSDVSTIMGTAQASGIAMVARGPTRAAVALHTPSEVKAAVSGNGRADKAQVGAMVTRILRLDAPPKPADAADALALAITHIWRGGAQARIDAAARRHLRQRTHAAQEASMIAFVRGQVAAVTLTSAVLEVGGVGLELMCTPGTLATLRPGQQATLPTSMVVREDSLTLFGFLDEDEKSIFELRADRLRGRAQAGPGDARGARARRPAPRGRRRRRQDPDPGARASARRAPSGSSSSSRTGSARPVGGAARVRRRRPPSRGATRSTRAWSGSAGRPGRRAGRRGRRRPRPATAPTSARCCAPPSHAEQGLTARCTRTTWTRGRGGATCAR